MYCYRCGAMIGTEQTVCPSCGATQPVVITPEHIHAASRRLSGHLHLLAILWYVVGVLWLIPAGIVVAVGSVSIVAIPPDNPGAQFARAFGPLILYSIGAFLVVIAILCFAAGWGLLHLRPWARALAIVLGSISLLHPPFGTALGIYTLWVLLSRDAGAEYDRLATAA